MFGLVQSQLENERETYKKLKEHQRNDYVAYLVLNRIQRDIHKLEQKVRDKREEIARKEGFKRGYSDKVTYILKEICSRSRVIYGECVNSVYRRLAYLKERGA